MKHMTFDAFSREIGASGAVETMAVQFAVQRGAHVIATASGAASQRLVRKLGAHRVIDAASKVG